MESRNNFALLTRNNNYTNLAILIDHIYVVFEDGALKGRSHQVRSQEVCNIWVFIYLF